MPKYYLGYYNDIYNGICMFRTTLLLQNYVLKEKSMRAFKGFIEIGIANAVREFEFEMPDDCTEDQIHEQAWEIACDYIEVYSEEAEE